MGNKKKGEAIPSGEIARSIRMRTDVWEKLDEDAERCRRSSNRQIEAMLITIYGMGNTGLCDLATAQDILKTPVFAANEMDSDPPQKAKASGKK